MISVKHLQSLTNKFANILMWVGAFGLLLMTAIIGWQVFGRFVLNSTPNWSEQAALILMIWYITFAAAAGVKLGFHIRIVALENAASPKIRKFMLYFNDTIVGLCGLAMLIWGVELVAGTWSHIVPTLGIPRGLAYLCIPISGLLIAVFTLERILETAFGLRDTKPTIGAGIS